MSTFDFVLEPPRSDSPTPTEVVHHLLSLDGFHRTPGDPGRIVFRDPETSVHASVLLHPALAAVPSPRAIEEGEEEDEESFADASLESSGDEEEDEDGDIVPELPFLMIAVPLFRPTFFLEEVDALVRSLAERFGLEVEIPELAHAEEEIAIEEAWRRAHVREAANLRDRSILVQWTPEASRAFVEYGRARRALTASYADAGIDVPAIQPARTPDGVGSLVVWNRSHPTALPRCDHILVVETAERKGWLRTKTVTQEAILNGHEVWDALASAAEYRTAPIPHMIVRPDSVTGEAASRLARIERTSTEFVKRTELVGVIDFDLPAATIGESAT